MDDLISRRAAIDALGEEPMVWSGKDEYEQGLNNQWQYDLNAIKAVPAAQQWIPCKERLPEESGMYIVSGKRKAWICKFIRINVAGVKIGGWENDACNPVVTAWMPLPEPYKEEN